jgi:anti-sigma factor (TIGR02949 family)
MSCENLRIQMHGYLDDELDPVRSREIEDHLRGCPGCQRAYQASRSLSAAIKSQASYFRAPSALEARIRSSLHATAKDAPRRVSWGMPVQWGWLGLGASLAFAVMLTWNLVLLPGTPFDRDQQLTEEVIGSHVRSLMADHLTDVGSSDQHTVKPWFDGKLDFSPPVTDFAARGFALVGGRLDYLNGHPVAALIYRHRLHPINVFIWPAQTAPDSALRAVSHQGFNIVSFIHAGMAYWAVSDLNPSELGQFVELLRG